MRFREWGRGSVVGRAVVALVAVIVPSVVLLGATAVPAAAAGGLRESATTTFAVDPAAGAVHVTVDVTATNTTPDTRNGNIINQAYFRGVIVPALAEATNFNATSDGGAALSVTSLPSSAPIAQDLEVHFSSNLFFNQTQGVHLHYDLPSGAPRSKSLTRVTTAFSTFVGWATGDPGAANVAIVVPRAFTVVLVGSATTRTTTGSTVTYSANAIADPYSWLVSVSARDDARLVSRTVTADGNRIKVRAFPDDPAWSAFVDGRVAKGVPQLEKLIGLPWPAADRLVITETVTPYLYGYAGWFIRHDNVIEIGDALDPQVILHEMSHLWFNDLLFSDRWISEGLAQEYASRTVAQLGGKLVAPKAVNAHDAGAIRLEAWSSVNLQDQISQAREAFGYNASWFVIHRVTNEVGLAAMRRVFLAASQRALPYIGTENPHSSVDLTWRAFLDYVDEIGRSKSADTLFATYVAPAGDGDLTRRRESRASYARLVAASNGWQAPLVLREAMSSWDFSTADSLLPAARALTATHDAIERSVKPLGLHSPARLKADYEYRVTDLGAVQREATADAAAARELVTASASVHGHHGLFASIGLIGAHDGSDLARARRSFTAGNAAQPRAASLSAEHAVADASGAGMLRSGIALGLVLLVALTSWALRVRSRRRSEAARTVEPDGPGTDSPGTHAIPFVGAVPGNDDVDPGGAG
jgi:hypothetical protein